MDYQKNIKYFKSNDKHFYIGIGILAVGAILFVLAMFLNLWFLPYQGPISVALIGAGAGVAFIPRSLRSNSRDLDDAVARATEKYAEKTAQAVGLEDSLIRNIKPVVVGDYTYEENALMRRAKDDRRVRTSVYTATAMLFTKTGIYLAQKKISLIQDLVTESDAEFVYSDLDGVSVVMEEKTFEDGTKAKIAFIVIMAGGKEAMRIPTAKGSAADKLCDDINHMISLSKK